MEVKYVRYSSKSQKADRQLNDSDKYDKIYVEQCSGATLFEERLEGSRLLADVKSGKIDSVCVEEISRLGRNTMDTFKTIKYFEDNNVKLSILNVNLSSHTESNTLNPMFSMIVTMLSTIAEQERESISERLDAGRVAARRRGVKFGRKEGAVEAKSIFMNKPKVKEIVKLINKNKYTIREIIKLTESSSNLVLKVKKLISQDNG
jgi:DNA invertase Pin-like site-specific DNA recombinase